jgi:hypothetical protein
LPSDLYLMSYLPFALLDFLGALRPAVAELSQRRELDSMLW